MKIVYQVPSESDVCDGMFSRCFQRVCEVKQMFRNLSGHCHVAALHPAAFEAL